jgi:protein-tyrosine phosphatase
MYRSPIAAETFRGLVLHDPKRKHWKVGSAGTWTTEGRLAPNDALEAARALGINLGAHQTRMVNKKMMEEYDLIVVMEEGHKEALQVEFPFAQNKIHLLAYLAQDMEYDIADPASSPGETRVILQEVAGMVRAGYEKICAAAEAVAR